MPTVLDDQNFNAHLHSTNICGHFNLFVSENVTTLGEIPVTEPTLYSICPQSGFNLAPQYLTTLRKKKRKRKLESDFWGSLAQKISRWGLVALIV